MTAGVSDSILRMDNERYYNYTNRFIIEATFDSHQFPVSTGFAYQGVEDHSDRAPPTLEWPYKERRLDFDNAVLLAGNVSYFRNYSKNSDGSFRIRLMAYALLPDRPDGSMFGYSSRAEKRYSAIFHDGQSYIDEVYSFEFLESLIPGERYIIIGRLEPLDIIGPISDTPAPVLSDWLTTGWWPQVFPLTGMPDNYLELDGCALLRELIEITNADPHTFDVVYTGDMSSIRRIAEGTMTMYEGRMLTDEDSRDGNNVCVVSQEMMSRRFLKIGDTISLRLGDKLFGQNAAVGAVAAVRERYADSFTDEFEFEIVGVFRNVDPERDRDTATELHWAYSENTVFVPMPFLPCDIPDDHVIRPGEFSFTIGDARDITAFLDEQRPYIENDLGLTLIFNDGGWLKVEKQLSRADILGVIKLILYALSVAAGIGLTAYLFIGRKKKEYAIMRALGRPKRSAGRSLYVPLGLLAAIAFAAGNFLARVSVSGAMERSLSAYAELGIGASSGIPASLTVFCLICELAAMALVTAFGIHRLGSKPVLELLQGDVNR